jgi:two-component system OmpR family response regulator
MLSLVGTRHCSTRDKLVDAAGLPAGEAASPSTPMVLRKVLVVDDEPDVAEMTSLLLSAYGMDVLTVHSAMEALALLAGDDQIDAVVSDIVMPGMSGLQLGDAIRAMHPQVKVVLISGYTLPSEFEGRERPYLFTTKPYKIETLLKLLRT